MTSPIPAPMSLLAELTHRCPLSCPYCSNPLELERKNQELSTEEWQKIIHEAAEMGVLQIHFSGGEPMARHDLPTLISYAHQQNLYTNLITSGVFINEKTLKELDEAGLDHIQLSFQDVLAEEADKISGFKNIQEKKHLAATLIQKSEIPLTFNFVLQRHNIKRIPEMFALARRYKAHRIEMAHTQYYGWALQNKHALLPTKEQLKEASYLVEKERAAQDILIDYVTPDYYADRPKPCMGGWGQRFINITPSGRVLPCHAAETIANIRFPHIRENSLKHIWEESEIFTLFRGTKWMPDPCKNCAHKEEDWGGCRCQALALTGSAKNTDPVCHLSPYRKIIEDIIEQNETQAIPEFKYRRFS